MQLKKESAERLFNVLYSWEAIKPHITKPTKNQKIPKNYKTINALKKNVSIKKV